jgi:hypothetical protein
LESSSFADESSPSSASDPKSDTKDPDWDPDVAKGSGSVSDAEDKDEDYVKDAVQTFYLWLKDIFRAVLPGLEIEVG